MRFSGEPAARSTTSTTVGSEIGRRREAPKNAHCTLRRWENRPTTCTWAMTWALAGVARKAARSPSATGRLISEGLAELVNSQRLGASDSATLEITMAIPAPMTSRGASEPRVANRRDVQRRAMTEPTINNGMAGAIWNPAAR